MRSVLMFLLVLCTSVSVHAQRTNFQTEFGIDLILPLIWASGNTPQTADLELIYRENTPNGDLRFKFIIASSSDEFLFLERTTIDTLKYFNYYHPRQSYGIDIGLSKNLEKENLNIYVGADLHFAYNVGSVLVYKEPCDFTISSGINCDYDREIRNQNYTLGVIPFLGTKIRLTDRLLFAVEFGTALNYTFGNRRLAARSGFEEKRFGEVDLRFNQWLNDFAVLYRF